MKKTITSLLCAATIAATSGAAVAAADGAVKIGVLTDMSGVYSALGGKGSVIAAQMAIDDFGGEVLGKKIEMVSADHQNKADIGSATARQWIDVDGVDMITDLLNSAVGIAVQNLASDKDTITMNTGAGSTSLTGEECTPYGIHYVYDTYALPVGTATAIVNGGGKSWFFITADYAFGHSLEENTSAVVESLGGSVVGAVRAPLATTDFSSYLLQAQSSGADVIGLANAGGDTINSIRQANEFGIVESGQQMAGMLVFITDIKSLGLEIAQGLQFTTAYYWDRNDESRKFGEAFMEKADAAPSMVQAGVYSSVMSYLQAVEAVGSDDAAKVREQLGKMEIDFFGSKGMIRKDGLFEHDMFLAKVKSADESKSDWDLLEIVSQIPGSEAFMTLEQGGCSL